MYLPSEDPDTRIECNGGPYYDSWTALLKIAYCLPYPQVGSTLVRAYSPLVMNQTSMTCGGKINPNNIITEKELPEDPTFNDIDGMPWYWLYRDKPLSSTLVLPFGFVNGGTL